MRADVAASALLATATAFVAAGCATPDVYVQPSAKDPHAIVEVRIFYHQPPPTRLTEKFLLNGLPISRPADRTEATPLIGTIRVPPGTLSWVFRASFSHVERGTRVRHYRVTKKYRCGTHSMGRGMNSYAVPEYCTRHYTKHRRESVTKTVLDGFCSANLSHRAAAGGEYRVQFDFYGTNRCTARCTTRSGPCP